MLTPDEFTIVKSERKRLADDLQRIAAGACPDIDAEEVAVVNLALRGLDSLIEEYNRRLVN